jgi:hypothetical protein
VGEPAPGHAAQPLAIEPVEALAAFLRHGGEARLHEHVQVAGGGGPAAREAVGERGQTVSTSGCSWTRSTAPARHSKIFTK